MKKPTSFILSAVAAAAVAGAAHADAVTDWNLMSGEFITQARIGTPPAVRVMALVQTAALHAVQSAPQRQAAAEAALAAAHQVALGTLLPVQQAAIDAAAQTALARIADGADKQAGIAAGASAAQAVLAARSDDGAATPESYRPHTLPGVYVPTTIAAATTWPQRKPWLMTSPAQFRPGPPPALISRRWARDFNEIKALGSKASTQRSAEQTQVARFWDYSLPAIYHGVVRSVALQPQRDLVRNARLFAAVAQGMDDAMIAVFDAKYHYDFWRPTTAIRNGDIDWNEATQREAGWLPLLDVPMHPEYPSGHSILAATVARVIEADSDGAPLPVLATSSPTAQGATRQWSRLEDFVREVSEARIHGGLHFRSATNAAERMGRQIGELAAGQVLGAAP